MEKSQIDLHKAAKEGTLDKVPKELLTTDNLMRPDHVGLTVFFRAIEFKHLDQIPPQLLTDETCFTGGWTVLHFAAATGQLDKIPKELLTEKNLLKYNNCASDNFSPVLQIAAECHNLDQLLGIELSDKIKDVVGTDWYVKNKAACEEMRKSKESLAVENSDNLQDVELF